MIFTKHRFEIWSQTQHPFKHSLGDFAYTNPAAPGVTTVEGAFGWLFAVLYPNAKASVANVAALPLVGNSLNDYRVVLDDGDGKAASYRWEQREGEVSASWHKIYDMDWGQDSILSAFQNRTQDLYVWRNGRTELDGSGSPITGLYAGQTVYGGDSANQNLTLKANSGDGTDPRTGFVQVDDIFRPTIHNTFDLGTSTFRWKDIYAQSSAVINTLSISSGLITDSSGAISFDNENLTTTGNITGAIVKGTTSLVVDIGVNSVTVTPGSYADTTGAISFGAASISTSGTLSAGVTTLTDNLQTIIIDPDVAGVGRITSSTGTINFDNEHLTTSGNIAGAILTGSRLDIDNLRLDGNTISVLDVNGNLILSANGIGIVDIQNQLTTLGITSTGVVGITGQLNIDSIRLDGNVISSTNLNGDITLSPNGSGVIISTALLKPNSDNSLDLGTTTATWNDVFLKGNFSDGTNSIAISTALAFRSGIWRDLAQTTPAQTGDTLFYDAVNSVWLASVPDTEVTHSAISGLTTGDSGHTQFAMLAGRSGGQMLQGGLAASENLILESTSHATKGEVFTKDDFLPFTNASYSGSWSGIDLGDATHYFRNIYTRGELKGARFENYTFATLPAASAQNIGRVVFATDVNKAYVDVGTSFKVLGISKFIADQTFDGIITTKNVDVSADISDAKNAVWQLRDNVNDFEILYVTIKATSSSNVRIETNTPLPSGSYRLIGLE
ncbi:MAG TPA: hypothetical protein VFF49_04770 [Thermodesulfobacteriota bacterium]|nr:hypothetical protein [Thermodesulfobacteriota bacterium]